MRIAIIYDCLYPHTVGGAERWYRELASRLREQGHDVTYLTLRQWERGEDVNFGGVRVLPVGPQSRLYTDGRRRIGPPVVFGVGVARHLIHTGHQYDVIHTASFPFFSVLAAGGLRSRHRAQLVIDWHEVWSDAYWRSYLGDVPGAVGWRIQKMCAHLRHSAFCFSALHSKRLRALGFDGDLTLLRGQYPGTLDAAVRQASRPEVVFLGRHIPEKQVPLIIPAVMKARQRVPNLHCTIYGDGPDRALVEQTILQCNAADVVHLEGFVPREVLEARLPRALALILPSRREGYGQVVVEASAAGVPSIVVAGPDNAAVELVEAGQNGLIAPSASADDLAEAIISIAQLGDGLRDRTAAWFARHQRDLSIDASLDLVVACYDRLAQTPSAGRR